MVKWHLNPFGLIPSAILALGLWFMPGEWWAKVLIFLGITLSLSVTIK